MNKWDVLDSGVNNQVDISLTAKLADGFQVRVYGKNNHLVIGENTVLGTGLIELRNTESSIKIGDNCILNGSFRCRAGQTHIRIGDKTTIMLAHISLHESGTITLGDDCMLSGDITMDVSDMHSILDVKSGIRINPPRDILIGDHVWLAQGVRIMKGSQIGQDCIIGSRALVCGSIPANSLAVGTPARVVRSGVTWDRRRIPASVDPEIGIAG
jgi:acetyltransferase-like isoleucine patch superfamily enzyme